jgi:hypothetical protein
MWRVAFFVLAGCSSSSAAPTMCTLHFSGNIVDDAVAPPCVTLKGQGDGTWSLAVDTSSQAVARLTASIDLGSTPATGVLSSDTLATWQVDGLSSTSNCVFSAGGASVPTGSFSLALSTVDTAQGVVHGTLDLVTYLHAPPLTDCGHGDIENIAIDF